MYIETEASKFIEKVDFAVIKIGDDHAILFTKVNVVTI